MSAAKLEFALNLFYRIRLREEYALQDNDTFMRVCAKHYQGENDVFPNTKKSSARANDLSVPGKRVRSPNTRFSNLSVPVGAKLVFTKDSHITCTVLDDSNQVEYDGKAWSISALAIHLLGVSSANGFCHFSYEGETLWERRLRLERVEKQDEYQVAEMPPPAEVQEAESRNHRLGGTAVIAIDLATVQKCWHQSACRGVDADELKMEKVWRILQARAGSTVSTVKAIHHKSSSLF